LRHQENLLPILKSILLFNKKIRISVAAILQIKHEDKYILIQNHHRPEFYAPIGGVYKHSGSHPEILDKIEWNSDYTKLGHKEADMKHDLRGVIYGKRFSTFLDWFSKRQGRENEQCIYRELKEELQEGRVGKVLRDKSSNIKIELLRSVLEGPHKVTDREYDAQFRYFDIYKIDNTNDDTALIVNELINRASKGDNNLILVTKDDIKRGRTLCGNKLIASHTKYYYSSEWHGQEPTKY
jgi:hypothetical protein